jgi:hypothetical protein
MLVSRSAGPAAVELNAVCHLLRCWVARRQTTNVLVTWLDRHIGFDPRALPFSNQLAQRSFPKLVVRVAHVCVRAVYGYGRGIAGRQVPFAGSLMRKDLNSVWFLFTSTSGLRSDPIEEARYITTDPLVPPNSQKCCRTGENGRAHHGPSSARQGRAGAGQGPAEVDSRVTRLCI